METKTVDTKKAFWELKNTSFEEASPDDDLLHREAGKSNSSAGLTETQYLGFNVPDQEVHGLCYLWHHPNLGVVSGGVWAWQGVKRHPLECELFDMQIYIDDDCLSGDLHEVELPNGYRSTMLEPLRRFQIQYTDPSRENSFEIELEAMMDPMMMSTGMHIEQGMKTRGALTLRGKEYEVDAYTVRDRSWGQSRPEAHLDAPPVAWMNSVFDDDFAIGVTAFDSEDTDPEWKGVLEIPGGDPVRGGWIWRDGGLVPVVSATKRTKRSFDRLIPESVEMTLTDAEGRTYEMNGTVIAAAPWQVWHNMDSFICLTRWEHEGRVGYGDLQEVVHYEYIRRFIGGNGRA